MGQNRSRSMKETACQPRTRAPPPPPREKEARRRSAERPGRKLGRREGRKTQGLTRAGRPARARPRRPPRHPAVRRPPEEPPTRLVGPVAPERPPGPPGCVRRTQRALPWFPGSIGASASVRHDPLSRLNEAERFVSVCTLVLLFVLSPSAIVPGQFRFRQKS